MESLSVAAPKLNPNIHNAYRRVEHGANDEASNVFNVRHKLKRIQKAAGVGGSYIMAAHEHARPNFIKNI